MNGFICHPHCSLPSNHGGGCQIITLGNYFAGTRPSWDGSHPPPAATVAEPCGCDEAKALRAEVSALRGRLARLEGGA